MRTSAHWNAIDTAPRDGVILLWFPDLKDQEAQFGYWHIYEDAPWYPGEWRDRDNSEEFIRGDNARVHPTHWAPPIAGPCRGHEFAKARRDCPGVCKHCGVEYDDR